MTTSEIAARLVILCRQGQFETAQKELYSKDAQSIEPESMGGFDKETKGLDAILEKGRKFGAMVEKINKVEVSEPLIVGNTFACSLHMDTVMKEQGHTDMLELCVYEVKDGKIIRETFYM